MKAWILYSRQDAEHNKRYIEFYIEEGERMDISFSLIFADDLYFGVEQGSWCCNYQGKQIEKPDFVVCRTIYPLLNRQLENMAIPVFNNAHVSEICNDKAKTYQYVAQASVKMVDSIFCKNQYLLPRLKQITCPTVVKAVNGHGGSQVFLLEPNQGAERIEEIYKAMKGEDVVMQPLTGNRHQDLRVYVIGNEIIAAVLRTAKEGFKSNFSLGGTVEQYHLSDVEIMIIKKIMALFDFGLVGIDFIVGDQGELIFNEIEDVVGARMLYSCSDINIVKLYLKYIQNKLVNSYSKDC